MQKSAKVHAENENSTDSVKAINMQIIKVSKRFKGDNSAN